MDYTSVEGPKDIAIRVPSEHTDDEDRRDAHAWLLRLAGPHYNRMLAAERDGRIPEALRQARAAVQYGAYVPRVVAGAFLVAAKHGDFDLARCLLERIRTLGLDDADAYEALLRRRVERWNQFLDDPTALREAYQQPTVTPSYRELLLLADRLDGPPTETEREHLSACGFVGEGPPRTQVASSNAESSSRVRRSGPALVAACLLGVLLGGGGLYLSQGDGSDAPPPPQTATSTPTPDSLVAPERYNAALRVSTLLAHGRPDRAYRALEGLHADSTQAAAVDSLRTATHRALSRAGRRAWDAGEYERVVRMLRPIREVSVGEPQEKLYALGVSAAQTGRDSLAVATLRALMPQIDARHPHYEAQAAYLLVERGPPQVARRYARLIADKYGGTIYDNSVVRARRTGE